MRAGPVWSWKGGNGRLPYNNPPPRPLPVSLRFRRNPQRFRTCRFAELLSRGTKERLSEQEDAIFWISAGLHVRLLMEVHIDNKMQQIYIAKKSGGHAWVRTKEHGEGERIANGSFIFHFPAVSIFGQSNFHCGDRKTWNLEPRHQKAI